MARPKAAPQKICIVSCRLPVRKIREELRHKAAGLSDRRIATAIGSARSTVQDCVRRANEASIAWPRPEGVVEAAIQERRYRRSVPLPGRPEPEFAQIRRELTRLGVTRILLWQEYKTA